MRVWTKALITGAACLAAVPLQAETLNVSGVYPAGNDNAAALNTIVVEPFGGIDGPALSIALEDRLRAVRIDGEPYFQILPATFAGSADSAIDAVLRGTVTTLTSDKRSYPKETQKCVARDDKRKCTERVDVKIPCRILSVAIQPRLRLIRSDGELIHADNSAIEQELRYCKDEDEPFAEPMIEQALADIARRTRFEFGPVHRHEDVRLLESRKGMKGAPRKAFRDAVKLTKMDPLQACINFADLEGAIGEHASLLYNLGLCAEGQGEYDRAISFYDRALLADPKKSLPQEGLNRIAARDHAQRQLEAHFASVQPQPETPN